MAAAVVEVGVVAVPAAGEAELGVAVVVPAAGVPGVEEAVRAVAEEAAGEVQAAGAGAEVRGEGVVEALVAGERVAVEEALEAVEAAAPVGAGAGLVVPGAPVAQVVEAQAGPGGPGGVAQLAQREQAAVAPPLALPAQGLDRAPDLQARAPAGPGRPEGAVARLLAGLAVGATEASATWLVSFRSSSEHGRPSPRPRYCQPTHWRRRRASRRADESGRSRSPS